MRQISIIDPYANESSVKIYRILSRYLRSNIKLFTYNGSISGKYHRLEIIKTDKNLIIPHSTTFKTYHEVLSSSDVVMWMIEVMSPGAYFLLQLRNKYYKKTAIITYSWENQTFDESIIAFKKNYSYFSNRFLLYKLYRRLVRIVFYEYFFRPRPQMFIHNLDKNLTCSKKSYELHKYRKINNEVLYFPVTLFSHNKNIELSQNIFIYVGRMVKEKGVLDLIREFNLSKLPLLMIGDGPLLENLKLEADRNIKFLGKLNNKDLQKIYDLPGTLILPSIDIPNWSEQYGRVIAEALCCGLNVIATDNKSLRSIYGNNINYINNVNEISILIKKEVISKNTYQFKEFYSRSFYKYLRNHLSNENFD